MQRKQVQQQMSMLNKVKLALRITHSKLDSEINENIDAAKEELERAGVPRDIATEPEKYPLAAAAGGHRFAAAEPLPRQPADGVSIVPEIPESVFLHFGEQLVSGYAGEDLLFIHWLGDSGKMEDIILYQSDSEHLSCKKSQSI